MSQGGRIALRYAVAHKHRLRSLILQSAGVDGLDVDESKDERIPFVEYADLARTGRLDEVRRRWREHPMMQLDAGCETEARLLGRIFADYTGADLVDFDKDRNRFSVDILEAVGTLNIPALLLTGARETAARKRHADEIQSRISACESLVLEDSGHLANLTEPARYNLAVREFCEKVEAGLTSL
jgi:pimeloyl-[acyl-carrier protein] methyl ester esterase